VESIGKDSVRSVSSGELLMCDEETKNLLHEIRDTILSQGSTDAKPNHGLHQRFSKTALDLWTMAMMSGTIFILIIVVGSLIEARLRGRW
jgi:hypothetical protein